MAQADEDAARRARWAKIDCKRLSRENLDMVERVLVGRREYGDEDSLDALADAQKIPQGDAA